MPLPIPKPPMFDGNPPPYDPKGDLAERCAKAEAELERVKLSLLNLLARIHRDGGQYTEQWGLDVSVKSADEIVCGLQATSDDYERTQNELERVTADRDNETKWAKQYHDDWVELRDELESIQEREERVRHMLVRCQEGASELAAYDIDFYRRAFPSLLEIQSALQPDAGTDFVPRAELEACQKREPASALRHCARCGAPIAPIEDDNGLCVKCSLNPRPAKTAAGVVYSELKRQRDTLQDMLLQATKQCDELNAKLTENEESREQLENERKLSAEFRRRLETVERMLKDSEACLADARVERDVARNQASEALVPRSELEAAQKREAAMRQAVEDFVHNVKHQHVAGWGDISSNVQVDASFQELKAALQPDAGDDRNQPFTCFSCRDGNTPLYCLNCAGDILKTKTQDQLDAMAAVVRSAYVHKDEVRKLVDALRMAELYVETEGSDEERSLLCKAFAHAKSLNL